MSRGGKPTQGQERRLSELKDLLANFEAELASKDLRSKVKALVPVFGSLRHLGRSLVDDSDSSSAHKRILAYLLKYPFEVVSTEELMVVAGIIDYQRRIRELRCEEGWKILSGETAKVLLKEDSAWQSKSESISLTPAQIRAMKPEDYILLGVEKDTDAARRWHVANRTRKLDLSVRDRVLCYLRENVGKPLFGEELAYVAKSSGDWPRRVRELRTEFGWPISTRESGRPDLGQGVYLLEEDRQAPAHDRHIPDLVRGEVLQRDGFSCQNCGWEQSQWHPADPRHLELHHRKEHVRGGDNTATNLITLCTVCHDELHAGRLELSELPRKP